MNIDELIEKARLTMVEMSKAVTDRRQILEMNGHKPNPQDSRFAIAQAQLNKVFSLPVIDAEVCPDCEGEGKRDYLNESNDAFMYHGECVACHGTGRTEPKTIRDILEEVL